MTEILGPGNGKGDVPPVMAGGEVMIVAIGGTVSVPSFHGVVAELKRAYPSYTLRDYGLT